MDIAAVAVLPAQNLGRRSQPLHGPVGRADDAGREEDAEQPLTAQVIHEQPGDLVRQERAAPDIPLVAQRTVTAIARTRIRKQRFHHDAVPARRQRNRIEPAPVQLAPAPLFIA